MKVKNIYSGQVLEVIEESTEGTLYGLGDAGRPIYHFDNGTWSFTDDWQVLPDTKISKTNDKEPKE